MADPTIDLTVTDRVARLELRRPDAGNAFTAAMMGELVRGGEPRRRRSRYSGDHGRRRRFLARPRPSGGSRQADALRGIPADHRAQHRARGVSRNRAVGRAGPRLRLRGRPDPAQRPGARRRRCTVRARRGSSWASRRCSSWPRFSSIWRPRPPPTSCCRAASSTPPRRARSAWCRAWWPPPDCVPPPTRWVAELKSRDPAVLRASKRYLAAVREVPRAARPAFALIEQARYAEGKR